MLWFLPLMSPKGVPAKILGLFHDAVIQVCVSENIIAEYGDVLLRPELKIEPVKIDMFLDNIKQTAIMIAPTKSDISLPDEDDRTFYDTAKECGATLVTGNTKHFPDEDFIMTPREFVDMME